jgi:hypothetical protein
MTVFDCFQGPPPQACLGIGCIGWGRPFLLLLPLISCLFFVAVRKMLLLAEASDGLAGAMVVVVAVVAEVALVVVDVAAVEAAVADPWQYIP